MRQDQVFATRDTILQRERRLEYLRETLRRTRTNKKPLIQEISAAEKELLFFTSKIPSSTPSLLPSQLSVSQKPTTSSGEIDSRKYCSMKDNETLETNEIPTDRLEKEFALTCGTKSIEGKPIHVTRRSTWRGKASPMTSKDKIGEDGLEDKYSCSFKEDVSCMIKEEKQTVHDSYITALMYKQLDQIAGDVSIDALFEEGKCTGVLYAVKRKNQKPGGSDYWSFVNEKQLKEVELV